jgi:hypothetical protein
MNLDDLVVVTFNGVRCMQNIESSGGRTKISLTMITCYNAIGFSTDFI